LLKLEGETDLTYDGFYDIGHMQPGKPLMSLSHYCSQPVNTRRPILFVNTGTLSWVAADISSFLACNSIYAERTICYCLSIRLSVCPSVCPSHGWISQKRLKLGSRNFHHRVA